MFGTFTKYQRTKGIDLQTRIHSSRMRTTRGSSRQLGRGSASVHVGIHNPRGSGPGDPPQMWTWRPPGCGPGDPPGQTPQPPPLGMGLETPLARLLNLPLGVGLETPLARPLNLPLGVGLVTCKACWDTTPPPWTDRHV